MKERTAIDTIKGYFYQFDLAIVKLLELKKDTETIVIEGIEDIDINTATEETAIQCKYHAKKEYNHSVIAKPIRLMLDHYKEVIEGAKKQINYKLYGYFESGQAKLTLPIDSTFLKKHFLTYTEKKVEYYHHIKHNLTDNELDDFISLLEININAMEYQSQVKKISTLLISQFGCKAFEAEHFFYNNALKVIKELSIEDDVKKRKISKSEFLKKIDLKRILFNEWFITYKGEAKLFTELRTQYFTALNISPFERFFIIEIPTTNYVRTELKDIIFTISKKWSKLSKREQKPFCPYIYLHNIPHKELLELKKELYSEDFIFIDGFDFDGAEFSVKSICKTANNDNSIKFKLLNKFEHINLTLNEINKTKEIYQFYCTNPFFNSSYINVKHVQIQISQLTDIKKIV
ncbi:DUF4297 family anti-phage-associated protein [Chryseobacterium lathyri]|jgi:hypothetical protein|uniref:CD-NTase associated protein 4-like DNA endonuclease domain-containing protein n=1 Tax=Chryseobacterium lathyri TaxID=395933 RepID=A0A511YAE7_9FLAO|nr:DUF4297 family anti-phage-associated protein [Chryseobacterium lathyri]GEN72155.1 hypothetical protein CLA01_22270 [Chryseobacterium lathyri]